MNNQIAFLFNSSDVDNRATFINDHEWIDKNSVFSDIAEIPNQFEYVVLCSNRTQLYSRLMSVYEEYLKIEQRDVLLPLISIYTGSEDDRKFMGIANTCCWKLELMQMLGLEKEDYGTLNHQLALLQADLIIEGALIRKQLLIDTPFDLSIKYYSHYNWLNKITKPIVNEDFTVDEVLVEAVPILLAEHLVDPALIDNNNTEEKVEYFKLSKTV